MSELTDIIDGLRNIARRFTDAADKEEISPYYSNQEAKKQRVERYREWSVKLEDAANTVTVVKVDMDKHD